MNKLELIKSKDDLMKNLEKTESLLNERNLYIRNIIARGTNFIFYKFDGRDRFIPSRFIGYKNISIDKHKKATNKQGGSTDYAISQILKLECCANKRMEKTFARFF